MRWRAAEKSEIVGERVGVVGQHVGMVGRVLLGALELAQALVQFADKQSRAAELAIAVAIERIERDGPLGMELGLVEQRVSAPDRSTHSMT